MFLLLKKRKMDEIEKNKNGKCLRICPLTSPDEDELIKRLSKILKHPTNTWMDEHTHEYGRT